MKCRKEHFRRYAAGPVLTDSDEGRVAGGGKHILNVCFDCSARLASEALC